ncbi:DNA methylase N-4 [Gulosibacter macacae]|uniref:DNA methylase N-4 n=1 Tax=Gulosibacter macacae TaxID=2488791 RepID=A0A3P3VZ30_9MICO|nr:DNA methyltransferase [Gulosibacter macacae]RRJ85933.1 DNA methylase N-4 [Gulosibacter macacae]
MSAILNNQFFARPSVPYEQFIRDKVAFDRSFGFEVDDTEISPTLKPHQRDIVKWAVAGGRRAIFARFGLGKSVMQLEALRLVIGHHRSPVYGGRALIVAPLGVRGEFIRDGHELLDLEVRFIRRTEEIDTAWSGIYVTNYESVRDGKLDPDEFAAVSLDEASVLRSFGSKTYQEFLPLFDRVSFRFVATATPSPNRHKELIHYAGFLGIMDTGQALTRFFQRDSTKAGNLTLYPHKEREFWLWLNTWACFVQRPSDLGHSDAGYDLPDLTVDWRPVEVDLMSGEVERDGQAVLVRSGARSLADAAREKRDSIGQRVDELMRIVRAHLEDGAGQVVLWCDLNAEQDAIERALKANEITFSSVHGGLDDEENERRLDAWRDRETVALIGKPVMLGQGMNLQQSHVAVFVGVTYKFNDTIQAVHRIQRFGQEHACTVHLIYAETEAEIRDELAAKWVEHDDLTETMSDVIREFGLNSDAISRELTRTMGVERVEEHGDEWTIALNDCVLETRDHMADNSVDLIVTSIPFSNHYEYTPSYNDFGHTDDNAHFWAQMDYLTPELLRVLRPGRIYACHVKDRIQFGAVTGAGIPTVSPFHAEALAHGLKWGFDYMGMITVTTDVVRENNQSYRLGYSEMRKDGSKMGVGSPEYILLFHKPQTNRAKGYADERITKDVDGYSLARWQIDAAADWRSSGDRLLAVDELAALPPEQRSRLFKRQWRENIYDFGAHVELGEALESKKALPSTFKSLDPGSWRPDVWDDVNRMLTLNGEQSRRALEFHICPLQFDIVDRLIERYSNVGELVFDPFGGLGTVPLRARKLGRQGRASELNPTSYRDAVMYQREMDEAQAVPTLFDLFDEVA